MLRIYHFRNTRGIRVIWLAEELGLPYELNSVDFSAEYRASPEWRALNPVGKVPVIVDDDVTMFESGAIVQYLLARYGRGALQPPVGDPDYAAYLQWSWFAEATLARPLGEIVNHRREFPGDAAIPRIEAEMTNRAILSLEAVGAYMQGREFLTAQFSAADIMMGYSLLLGEMLLGERFPQSVRAYWRRLERRPALIKARSH